MTHGQPVLARLQLSQDAGLAVLPRSPSQARTAPGSADPWDVSTVSLTLGNHDVGGGASDLEDDASLRNRTDD